MQKISTSSVAAFFAVLFSFSVLEAGPGSITYEPTGGAAGAKHVVLLAGDEEYRSEEALPMLGKILSQRHGLKCTVLFSVDADGTINPDNGASLGDSEVLETADLFLMSLRFRKWDETAVTRFEKRFLEGTPVVGLRTSTHAFQGNRLGSFGKKVLGEQWVSHWGRHKSEATRGVIEAGAAGDALLKGVRDVFGTTDVYEAYPPADARILMRGMVLAGMLPDASAAAYTKKRANDKMEQGVNEPMMPIAWTRQHTNESGKTNRVFCTTMGAACEFVNEGLRRLVVNAVYWGLGKEVPAEADVRFVDEYDPSFYGFKGYRKGLKVSDFAIGAKVPGEPLPPPASAIPAKK